MVPWHQGRFHLLTSALQLDESRRVTRYQKIRERLSPALARRLLNELRGLAELVPNLPLVTASADPGDNYLLATDAARNADLLVTGDKSGLLALRLCEGARIITVREFLDSHR